MATRGAGRRSTRSPCPYPVNKLYCGAPYTYTFTPTHRCCDKFCKKSLLTHNNTHTLMVSCSTHTLTLIRDTHKCDTRAGALTSTNTPMSHSHVRTHTHTSAIGGPLIPPMRSTPQPRLTQDCSHTREHIQHTQHRNTHHMKEKTKFPKSSTAVASTIQIRQT